MKLHRWRLHISSRLASTSNNTTSLTKTRRSSHCKWLQSKKSAKRLRWIESRWSLSISNKWLRSLNLKPRLLHSSMRKTASMPAWSLHKRRSIWRLRTWKHSPRARVIAMNSKLRSLMLKYNSFRIRSSKTSLNYKAKTRCTINLNSSCMRTKKIPRHPRVSWRLTSLRR